MIRLLASEKGATIIEAVVALALAGVIVTALMAMVVSALATSTTSKNRAIATRYAEAAIETMRTYRDQTDWTDFYNGYVSPGNIVNCSSVCYLTASNTLTNSANAAANISPFTRTIKLTDDSPSASPKSRVFVDVKVTWNDRGQTQTEEETTYLTNWSK